jgi:hypothetical protein
MFRHRRGFWLVVIASGLAASCTSSGDVGSTRPSPAAAVASAATSSARPLACASHNVGNPTYEGNPGEDVPPLKLATRWAGSKYPGAQPSVEFADPSTAQVSFDSSTGRQAILHYANDGHGWYLVGLAYC